METLQALNYGALPMSGDFWVAQIVCHFYGSKGKNALWRCTKNSQCTNTANFPQALNA
ncbi:hypothetical protein [Pseudomonas putida]